MVTNIAIDGPAGAGKSTIAKRVAKELSFIYVDTGAMYRAMALYLLRNHIRPEDSASMESACQSADVSIIHKNGEQQVLLNGENVTGQLRTEEVGNMASVSSANPKVREKLMQLQQDLARTNSVVMDGRDIGTKVLPDAGVKIYLIASARTRALRRYQELVKQGVSCDLDEIERDIILRDERDMKREISPLCQADDAVLVDSSDLGIDEVVEKIMAVYRARSEQR